MECRNPQRYLRFHQDLKTIPAQGRFDNRKKVAIEYGYTNKPKVHSTIQKSIKAKIAEAAVWVQFQFAATYQPGLPIPTCQMVRKLQDLQIATDTNSGLTTNDISGSETIPLVGFYQSTASQF